MNLQGIIVIYEIVQKEIIIVVKNMYKLNIFLNYLGKRKKYVFHLTYLYV